MERIAIVGAGMSGLVTAKELLDEGHDIVIFEQEPRLGGTFTTGVAYDRMHLTVSNYFMAFSSMPPPAGQHRYFWSRAEYIDYLHRFTEKFGLAEHVRLGSRVTGVRREGAQAFSVRSESSDGVREETFTAVAICRGAFRGTSPRMIRLNGMENYAGEIVHTAQWRGVERFRGKRVLCVGMGETSADITKWISDVAKECWLSMRSCPALLERYPFGGADTSDAFSTRITHWADPYRFLNRLMLAMDEYRGEMPAHNRLVWDWTRQSQPGRFLQKNDVFVDNVLSGHIKPVFSGVKRLEGKRVTFEDGQSVEADMVMLCTGYEEASIPSGWVDGLDIPDVRKLFKHMFHPGWGSRLAFIGWARPMQGGVPAAAEMQARLFALACSGKWTLPEKEDVLYRIAVDEARENTATQGNPYMRTLVHYTDYMDSMADLIDCRPKLEDYLRDPELLYHLVCGSNLAISYRLVGPHADPAAARDVLLCLPVALERSMPHRDIFSQVLVPHALEGRVSPPRLDQVASILKSRFLRGCEGKPSTFIQGTPPCFS